MPKQSAREGQHAGTRVQKTNVNQIGPRHRARRLRKSVSPAAREHRLGANRRHRAVQRQDPYRRPGFFGARGAGHQPRRGAGHGHIGCDEETHGRKGKTGRSRRPHRDSGANRRAHSRYPRRADVRHRGQLDRRADPQGCAGEDPPGRQDPKARFVDRGGRRLDRGAICREAAADRP